MSGAEVAAAIAVFAAVNPAAVLAASPGRVSPRDAATAGLLVTVVLIVAALVADGVLDLLGVAPESFRVAAGVVIAMQAARTLWDPGPIIRTGSGTGLGWVPLGWPYAANAGAIAAAMAGAQEGTTAVAWAALVAGIAVAVLLRFTLRSSSSDGAARLSAAIVIALAAQLIVSGVRDV